MSAFATGMEFRLPNCIPIQFVPWPDAIWCVCGWELNQPLFVFKPVSLSEIPTLFNFTSAHEAKR